MILISHRGNITGKQPELENDPNYIRAALDENYDVEIDVWHINGFFYRSWYPSIWTSKWFVIKFF